MQRELSSEEYCRKKDEKYTKIFGVIVLSVMVVLIIKLFYASSTGNWKDDISFILGNNERVSNNLRDQQTTRPVNQNYDNDHHIITSRTTSNVNGTGGVTFTIHVHRPSNSPSAPLEEQIINT
ncbi:CLUMA_CG009428, isoform A [Clunio marinus]|uniref:CLUMA_CG009428, isoform A n=1 Tax=Clunio marinus TaxID=568069 RepID=A0A1J1I725_9DIPT|nr:CLUMA_CG009428, isoform A [Clunio marinus]